MASLLVSIRALQAAHNARRRPQAMSESLTLEGEGRWSPRQSLRSNSLDRPHTHEVPDTAWGRRQQAQGDAEELTAMENALINSVQSNQSSPLAMSLRSNYDTFSSRPARTQTGAGGDDGRPSKEVDSVRTATANSLDVIDRTNSSISLRERRLVRTLSHGGAVGGAGNSVGRSTEDKAAEASSTTITVFPNASGNDSSPVRSVAARGVSIRDTPTFRNATPGSNQVHFDR